MGMGHLHLRKMLKRDTNWIEKGVEKHKHEYTLPYVLETISPNKKTSYYHILKCTKCNSFKSIPKPNSIFGLIGFEKSDFTQNEIKLPKIIAYKKHEYLLGFYDIERIEIEN